MTLRRAEIIEWSTTPKELRRVADQLETQANINEEMKSQGKYKDLQENIYVLYGTDMQLKISLAYLEWQAEQTEDKE